MCIELLAIRLRNSVPGINISGIEPKVALFADDMNNFCGSYDTAKEVLSIIDQFTIISGLALNSKKTHILPTGSYRGTECPKFIKDRGLVWQPDQVETLGTIFSNESDISYEEVFKEKLCEYKKVLNNWKSRNLTLLG